MLSPEMMFVRMLVDKGLLLSVSAFSDAHDSVTFMPGVDDATQASIMDMWANRANASYPLCQRANAIAQIAALEQENTITPRATREFMLAVATLLHVPLDANPGLAKAKALNDQITALRQGMPPL